MLREIEIPLHFNNLGLDPKDAGKLKFADVVQATFSVLTGRRGNQQWPLEVNADNELKVSAENGVQALGDKGLPYKQYSDSGVVLASISNTTAGSVATVNDGDILTTGTTALCVSDPNSRGVLEDIYDILDDVYDETEGALKTYS